MHTSGVLSSDLLDRLARANAAQSAEWVRRVPRADSSSLAIGLADDVPRQARIDLKRGERLATTALLLARRSRHAVTSARALRALGHSHALSSRFRPAFTCYSQAVRIFAAHGEAIQQAVTFSGAIHTLAYLGRYAQADQWAKAARRIFRRHGDHLRLARLESNVGNLHFRQDRFRPALTHYRRAEASLRACGAYQDAAEAMRNVAVCLTSLNMFDDARTAYADVARFSQQHSLTMLAAAADYNIAYLYFLCGQYGHALSAYAEARSRSETLGDPYHRTLCDLDEAEVCLELNDLPGARRYAEAAERGFAALGMRYERAKAMTFLANTRVRAGEGVAALALYQRARRLFAAEGNQSWVAAVDLARAAACLRLGRTAQAHALSLAADRRPLSASLRVFWLVLRTQIALKRGDIRAAVVSSSRAEHALADVPLPGLRWQVYRVLADAAEAQGDTKRAEAAFVRARREIERLRSQLAGDVLKIPFLGDKLAVYEGLVQLALRGGPSRDADVFQLIEHAKSRSLAELLAFRATELQAPRRSSDSGTARVTALSQQQHARERQVARASFSSTASVDAVRRLRAGADAGERRLRAALAELSDSDDDFLSIRAGGAAQLDEIRQALPEGTVILEYYAARGQLYACVLDTQHVRVTSVAPLADVLGTLQLLRFQLAKFQLGPDYVRSFADVLAAATARHLRALYAQLVAPVRQWLNGTHLIVVPHGALHYLPFHALHSGSSALLDDYTISYAPSASVFRLCQAQPASPHESSLVLALADELAPHIATEAKCVAQSLPDAVLRSGAEATAGTLRELGTRSRFLHIATHAYFRRDNPLLSSIRLSDGDLSLADIYGLRLDAELVTLSGCGTGLSAVVGGDELVGLMRGFLYAGARSLLLTMWQVDDLSTAEFMTAFYGYLRAGRSKAVAFQAATKDVRKRFPHPYYWAPFMLVGAAVEASSSGRTA